MGLRALGLAGAGLRALGLAGAGLRALGLARAGLRALGLVGVMLLPSAPSYPSAWLQIQGARWKHIDVNGKSLGYAPVAFNLQPYVTYRIGITSHKGFEHKNIRLRPDEVRVIADE